MTSKAIVPRSRGARPPSTAASRHIPPPTLLCNLCTKPLATTCFLCSCDCIFCEECTFNHFEHSSECPKCGKVLHERDFTELVVSNCSSNSNKDAVQTSLQTLFSRQPQRGGSSSNNPHLPFSDLCFGIIRQIDINKQSTKFLLKQLLMETSMSHKRFLQARSIQLKMKEEITRLKQTIQSQKLQYEQVHEDLRRKLEAKERKNAELIHEIKSKEKQIDQFRQLHSNGIPGANNSSLHNNATAMPLNHIPNSSSSGHHNRGQHEPPLRGIRMQKEAKEKHRMELLQQGATSSLNNHGKRNHSVLGSLMQRSSSVNNQHSHHRNHAMSMRRPFSGASATSSQGVPVTPRIRDLSSASGYTFNASSGSNGRGGMSMNKRMRIPTPTGLSPNTAFAHNNSNNRSHQAWSSGSGQGNFMRR